MNRRLPRLALAFVCLAVLPACVVNLSFDMDQSNVALQSPAAGSASKSIQVDLGKSREVAEHKDNIKSLDLDSVDVTVTSVNAGNQAKVLNGTLALRRNAADPAANDVKVGDIVNLPVVAGSTVRIKGNPALDAFLLEQLHNGGTFFVVANGTVDNRADMVLDLNLHASMGYDAGIL
ncbi:MAG: hypothetical protein ACM3PC_05820 [Deltaproteobacteria bacterium]